jgi:hypothetical protein
VRRRPWRRYAATVLIATGGLYTGYHYSYGTETPPVNPGSTVANIWVDQTGGTCADSASLIEYTDAGSCSTISAAFASAEPGDIIAVEAGTYPYETFLNRASLNDLVPGCDPYGVWGAASSANCIKIIPDGQVTVRGWTNHASSMWLKGNVTGTSGAGAGNPQAFRSRTYDFHITNTDLIGDPPPGVLVDANCNCKSINFQAARPNGTSVSTPRPDHVIIDGIDSDTMATYSADYVHARLVDVGPMIYDTPTRGSNTGAGPDVPRIWNWGNVGPPTEIVYDSIFFHNINRSFWCSVNNRCHPDGLYINSGGPITLKNSAFSQVAGEVFFIENFAGNTPAVNNLTVENNWFGCKVNGFETGGLSAATTCGSGPSVKIKECGTNCTNILFRFNSWHSITSTETDWVNVRFVGNAGGQPGGADDFCTDAGVTWSYNAWYTQGSGSNCGATNVNSGSSLATSLFTSTTPGSEDFHLTTGLIVADNFVDPTTSDYTVTTDFEGDARTAGNRDAGADER